MRIELRLAPSFETPLPIERVKDLATGSRPEDYEFGDIHQAGRRIVVYARRKSRIPAEKGGAA